METRGNTNRPETKRPVFGRETTCQGEEVRIIKYSLTMTGLRMQTLRNNTAVDSHQHRGCYITVNINPGHRNCPRAGMSTTGVYR